jgi:hypothetical protein
LAGYSKISNESLPNVERRQRRTTVSIQANNKVEHLSAGSHKLLNSGREKISSLLQSEEPTLALFPSAHWPGTLVPKKRLRAALLFGEF